MADHIILVDLLDREIGYEEKMKAHVRPMLHRAFSIFLYHDGKFLLQGGPSANITQGACGPIPAVPTRGGEKRLHRQWTDGCGRRPGSPAR